MRRRSSPDEILRDVCGLQAQVLEAAALGLRARGAGLQIGDVRMALNEGRSIVRTWLMRGTLHLVAADDLDLMLGVLGPVFAAGSQSRQAQLGLDEETKSRGLAAIRRILAAGGPLTRSEVVERLRRHGISLDRKTQAPIHLIHLAAMHGVLCLGPERDNREPSYVLIEDWIDNRRSKSKESALAELCRRYFEAYGPATLEDLAAWSGLPIAQARAGLVAALKALEEVEIERRPAFMIKGQLELWKRAGTRPSVRLLPAFDTYLLGHRARNLAVPIALQRRLQRGGGWIHPAVLVDGRAVAAWSIRRTASRARIKLEMRPANSTVRNGIGGEVSDVGRFLGVEATLETGEPATPAPRKRRTSR